ncbi:MAG: AcrB/AcrD/AcrF family protein [Candidatus Latescibacteria bacterium]|nr:AcrB/AcrD/AcrF family protein [Candidatus Latescibacterota bacterium]NIM22562.1 AcrB/AcrD/AcrF family protein [Candidatus Latescibacterota bacterium]NIM64851.1 AcrB/AcrD/AcrF family protein [Candidatus Latescibacterota bacterium]NIO01366.1 AcrB/AcrD/AcrF family protein [Candidatus Latescibacterota bacterium]NIO27876.1 AcrB/AcrD/AcrF family protein [Candidatus Latescibacterota bacterium]
MYSFFKFFAERHLLAHLVTLMTILLGLSALTRIKRDMFPRVDFGETFITTRYPGASPEDVELNVTNNIEEELKEVEGIDRMASYSMENISIVHVVIDPDSKDQDEVKREIREAVGRVTDFPAEVTESPLVEDLKTTIFPVIEVGLTGDISYRELREQARLFEKKLLEVPGVSKVEKFSYRDREIKVEISPEAIQKYQIPMREIMAAISARNIRLTGGSFESYTSEKNVVTLAQFKNPFEVGDVIVRSTFDGPLIRVKDLAIIKDDFEDEKTLSRMDGREAISFLVYKKESADVIRTVDAIKELVEEESKTIAGGIEILYSHDISRFVRNRLDVVRSNGLIGLSFVLILLSMFLHIRTAFWVALGIPVTLFGVVFLLPFFDAFLDAIALAAMIQVIGIVVDDAIIIAENIHRRTEKGEAPLEAAARGIQEVFAPVITTILTTFFAFAPLFFMSGLLGKFVFVVPLVICLALLVSLGEAIVALPAHVVMGLRGMSKKAGRVRTHWFDALRKHYERTVYHLLKLRYVFVVLSVALLAGAFWYTANYMDFVLFPSSAADEFYILTELPTGTSLQATSDKMREIESVVKSLPDDELGSFVTRIGTHGFFAAGENENWAHLAVHLTPFASRDRTADEVVEELRAKTDRLEGFEKIVYIIDAGGPPVGRPITIRVVGSDDRSRTELADSVVSKLMSIDGVKDIDRDDKLGKSQVEIKLDFAKLSRLGLTVADVARYVRIGYDGEVVTSVRYGEEDVDFRVLLEEKARARPEFLNELLIANQQGRLIPLKDVARLVTAPGPANFYHFDGERAVTITADILKGMVTPLEATKAVLNHFDLDEDWRGLRFVVGGEAEETQESIASLRVAFITAVIGIYFLLILLFNSLTQPILVMSAVPFGLVGVVMAFALHGQPLGFLAMMGVIGLSGVVVNDSLVLVSHVNRLRKQNPQELLIRIVAKGTADRLRPILLTTLTTVAGLLPLAYGIGGTDPFIAPMPLAIGYGLLFSTPLTLALVPSFYIIGDDISRAFSWMFRRGRKTRNA